MKAKDINPDESIILHPETKQLLFWNSWFQKYYSNDFKVSLTHDKWIKEREEKK